MNLFHGLRQPGVRAALGAALLFGAGTPMAKLLLGSISPWLLAGLFYLGSGVGLGLYRQVTGATPIRLPRSEWFWLLGAVAAGGVMGPVLLMFGLTGMPASGASLLLNAEGVFTALLAWFAFKENFDRRIGLGLLAIVAGALVLSWPGEVRFAGLWPVLAVLGACLAWGVDNNLTRKISLTDATWLASVKGLVAGFVNLILALAIGERLPAIDHVVQALVIGFFAYGVSLVLFVLGLRHLGAARTGAYFSIAPFFGAALALALGEPLTLTLLVAGALMALGLVLHLTEQHVHAHEHEVMEHAHEHTHDDHHQHDHDTAIAPGVSHSHLHRHAPLHHAHAHFPDAHHRHGH